MKNKNLLILCPSFPDKENKFYGGIFVKEYISSIKEYFNKVYVISPVPSVFLFKTQNEKICKNYKYDNVEVYYPKHFHLPIKYFREKIGDNQFKIVDKLIQKLNLEFDVIHAHFTWPSGYIGVKLKEKYGKKIIITGHGYDIYDLPFKNNYWKEKIKNILKQADIITTVSKNNQEKFKKLGFNSIIIPNGYNENLFYLITEENKKLQKTKLNIPKDKKIILNVGNLVQAKNQKTLILACKELLNTRNDFICYIIGDGPLKKELEKIIKENNLENFIKLLGRKTPKEVAKYMQVSDLFVLPSLSESFGIVQIEAMACGIPVVATINGGSEEIIISEDYGFLLEEKNNPKLLAKKINEGLEKSWDKEKIIKYVENKFTYNKIKNEYLKIFNQLF